MACLHSVLLTEYYYYNQEITKGLTSQPWWSISMHQRSVRHQFTYNIVNKIKDVSANQWKGKREGEQEGKGVNKGEGQGVRVGGEMESKGKAYKPCLWQI